MKSMKMTKLVAVALVSGLLLGGCAQSMSGGAYTRTQAREAQRVEYGTVESVRQVQIEGTKTPIGVASGAALGGVAGSQIGGGSGKVAATIGGVLLGGLAGAAAEEAVTRRPGLEITVRLDTGQTIAVTQEADEPFAPGERVRVVRAYDGTTRVSH